MTDDAPTLDESTIAALKAKHGALTLLESDAMEGVRLVVRNPKRIEYDRFHEEMNGEQATGAMLTLLRSVLVWPDATAFEAVLNRYPGAAQEFGREISRLAGVSGRARASKL